MKNQNINIIKDSINYLKIFLTLSPKAKDFLHIGQAVANPLKVSYIKREKINSLLEHADIEISKYPTRKQREKYFTLTSVEKLLKELFILNTQKENYKLTNVCESIDEHLKQSIKSEFFIEEDVAGFYSEELKKYTYHRNGSCMSGKPKSFFEIYDLINENEKQNVKIVGLKSNNLVIARALLFKKESQKLNGEITNQYFLDRIYVADFLQNSSYDKLQLQLFLNVKKAYKLENLNCYNRRQVQSEIKTNHSKVIAEKLAFQSKYTQPTFSLIMRTDKVKELSRYPYLDTFRYLDDTGFMNCEDDNSILIFDQTDGEVTDVDNNCICGQCESSFNDNDDEIQYSELEQDYICQDCSAYIDEREDICFESNATYNNYSGYYHYSEDLS